MPVDDKLLEDARGASDRMNAAQAALVTARTEFEKAVRTLAEAGASLEELVQVLGLNPVSVNRILGGRGTDILVCSFCRRSQRDVRKLIAGSGVYICDDCVHLAAKAAAAGEDRGNQSAELTAVPRTAESEICAFCGKARTRVEHLVSGRDGTTICGECVDLCLEIVTEEQIP